MTVGIAQCTTSRIVREYPPAKESHGKQVDFCLNSDADEASQATTDWIRASLLVLMIGFCLTFGR